MKSFTVWNKGLQITIASKSNKICKKVAQKCPKSFIDAVKIT